MEKVVYEKNEFESDKDYSVMITMTGYCNAIGICGMISGELLNELDDVLTKIFDYSEEHKLDYIRPYIKPSSDTPYRIWWKKLDKDGNVVDHGVNPNPYKRETTAKAKALVKYGLPDSPYVYEVSQSVPWPELGYFKNVTYSNK